MNSLLLRWQPAIFTAILLHFGWRMADFDGRLRIRVLQLAQLDSQMWTSMVSGGNDCLEFLNRVSDVRFVSGPPSNIEF